MTDNLKRIESPLVKWQGYIVVPQYLNFRRLAEWESAIRSLGEDGSSNLFKMTDTVLPFICDFVLEWHIEKLPEKLTPDDFPGSVTFLNWLIETINEIFEITNEPEDAKNLQGG